MSELFENMESLSPRLRWMQKHKIKVQAADNGEWIAYKSGSKHFWRDKVQEDAIVGLAKKIKIRLWNEE